jgi:thiol-disulfide isomerase/thioredoxin
MKHKPFYLLIFFGFLGCSVNKDNDISKVKLKELTGQSIDLAQFEGKAVFINFWATWCKPCIVEMPTIAAAQEKLKNEKVVFLFASNEEPDRIEKFAKKHSYDFHYVRLENMEALKIQALPTTFIFDPEGKIKFSENGFRAWDEAVNIELITKIVTNNEK